MTRHSAELLWVKLQIQRFLALFVSRNANKVTTNCTVSWEYRVSAGKSLCFTDNSKAVGENRHKRMWALTVQLILSYLKSQEQSPVLLLYSYSTP